MLTYPRILFAALVLKALFILFFINGEWISLGPDEAQYWTWSRALDIGYYSKPPGIAWQIFLGTLFFGNTELGVRVVSVLIGFLIPSAIYRLGIKSGFTERASFLGAFAFTFSPLGFLSSFFAITDVGSVLFFTLGLTVLIEGLKTEHTRYIRAGIFIALGALFKWVVFYFWIFALPTLLLKKGKPKEFLAGICISLLGLLPSLLWNIRHDYVTFLHVYYQAGSKGDIAPNKQLISLKSLFDFLGAEAALVSPILFIMLLVALGALLFKWKSIKIEPKFLGTSTIATLGVFSLAALFMKIQGNWCDFIYPAGFCYLGWYFENQGRKLLYFGTYLSLFLTVYFFATPVLENTPLALPYKQNPFKHNLGWNNLKDALFKAGYNQDKHFLFAPKYQTVSLLTFYGPGQKKAYFFNLHGARLNQFSFWNGMKDERKGEDGFFVVIENIPHIEGERKKIEQRVSELSPYFEKVSYRGEYPLYQSQGKVVKAALIFFGKGFKGEEPEPPKKY